MIAEAQQRLESNRRDAVEASEKPLETFLDQGLMNAQNLLVLDLVKCTRCDECTKACADTHQGVTRLIREGLRFDKFLVASSCRSCLDPYCMIGCPVGSIRRKLTSEIVIENWCIGCGLCAENCPYGNINMVEQFDSKKAERAQGDDLRPLPEPGPQPRAKLRLRLPPRRRPPHERPRALRPGARVHSDNRTARKMRWSSMTPSAALRGKGRGEGFPLRQFAAGSSILRVQ